MTNPLHELAAKDRRIEELERLDRFLEWRGIEVPCPQCGGTGWRAYPSTAVWRGGIGGQQITHAVCDLCWGSGDSEEHWTDLRIVSKKLDDAEELQDAVDRWKKSSASYMKSAAAERDRANKLQAMVDEMQERHPRELRELQEAFEAAHERADKTEAELRDTSSFCSRLQARVHLLEQFNAELAASEVGQLQEQLTAALQDKDVAEAERDEARRELIVSLNTHDYAAAADRRWGSGEGSRLFPEEADRG